MGYQSLEECIIDLEKNGHLIRVKEEVDPNLEMASIHLRVFENKGPAILFENIKGTKFRAVSNLFGTLERSRFIFRDTIEQVKQLIDLKNDPIKALKNPLKNITTGIAAFNALPKKSYSNPILFSECKISDLPLIKHWEKDGGAFVTLPQVYTEDIESPGIMSSNLGMYRVQLTGNEYIQDKEIGLHYQLHRGIGIHQTKANKQGKPLKVSIFVGGPPSHTFSAVMPLPEGMSELTFAGVLGNRRFRYTTIDGYTLSSDTDFVIIGEVFPHQNKPEGPFGDHLGYYSLKHDFPLLKVHKVFHKKDAIWPFTVVGRPPQEDTQFGALIHEISGAAIPKEIPGVKEVNAVDAAGVHPLLLAIGSERYTPYLNQKRPQELLTQANHILGFGQMSLAKYLFICSDESNSISTHNIEDYFKYVLERIDLKRDIHFYTQTSIDTLDYSGDGLNTGSKVVFAACDEKIRDLGTSIENLNLPEGFSNPLVCFNGVLAISSKYTNESNEAKQKYLLSSFLEKQKEAIKGFPLIIVCDDSSFVAQTLNNFLWVTFTRSNPSHDIFGVNEFYENKHWGCKSSLIIDARIKPHHAPVLELNPLVEKKVDELGKKGGSLYGII